MEDEEIRTKYKISEKCNFHGGRIPQLENIRFLAVRFPKKGHLVLHENNVITFSSRASKPILQLIDEKENYPIYFQSILGRKSIS